MLSDKRMMMVSEITNKEELDEMKAIMEIFFVTGRVKELALQN